MKLKSGGVGVAMGRWRELVEDVDGVCDENEILKKLRTRDVRMRG